MDFHAEQYEQALTLKDAIASLANWQTFFPYRPTTTPMEDPKAWWRYGTRRTTCACYVYRFWFLVFGFVFFPAFGILSHLDK